MSTLAIRALGDEDLPFARQMFYEAAFWRPDTERPPLTDALAQRDLAIYLDGWGRAGDHGLIAKVRGQQAGAVWVRRLEATRHGYGYLDDQTPELTLAVAAPFRRHGIARCLLSAILTQQRLEGMTRLSLSVEDDNPARELYRQLGFTVHQADAGASTMVRLLAEHRAPNPVVGGGDHPVPHREARP